MILGIPKEMKAQEYRVSLTPSAVKKLVQQGIEVLVQKSAGVGAGFLDSDYKKAGANLITDAKKIWNQSDVILKVKEPLLKEFSYFRPGLILFTYLHLANVPQLTQKLLQRKVTAIAYETILDETGALPLLRPMSEIAGKLAVQVGAEYLRTDRGKKGILLSRISGTRPAHVTILGAGNVGQGALQMALGMGAQVSLFDKNNERLKSVLSQYASSLALDYPNASLMTYEMSSKKLSSILKETDLLIGAVLVPGTRAPILVTKKMVQEMQPGSVIVDVAVDQGGCVETIHATTHAKPVYEYQKIIHYGVSNMPSLVARSATEALVHVTFPYVQKLMKGGFSVVQADRGFLMGLQTYEGRLMNRLLE